MKRFLIGQSYFNARLWSLSYQEFRGVLVEIVCRRTCQSSSERTAEREKQMPDRIGLGLIQIDPGVGGGWRANTIQDVARAAEDAGFDAIVCAEVNNDSMATALLMGTATRQIKVGTWVANIYLRLPYLCAKNAALVADATSGRFILGLGVSINQSIRHLASTCLTQQEHSANMLSRLPTGCEAKVRLRICRSSPRQ
jgi:hypothetical protein